MKDGTGTDSNEKIYDCGLQYEEGVHLSFEIALHGALFMLTLEHGVPSFFRKVGLAEAHVTKRSSNVILSHSITSESLARILWGISGPWSPDSSAPALERKKFPKTFKIN